MDGLHKKSFTECFFHFGCYLVDAIKFESNRIIWKWAQKWIESIGKHLQYHQKVDKLLDRIGDKRFIYLQTRCDSKLHVVSHQFNYLAAFKMSRYNL